MSTNDSIAPAAPLLDVEQTLMHREAGEAATAVERLLAANGPAIARVAIRLRARPPSSVITCARGSSDHAATYGKYVIETLAGIPTASAAPSISSLLAAPVRAEGSLCIALSQSGRSPDLLAAVEAYQKAGAFVVALVNDAESPLAALADEAFPLHAGPERSVAATKSYIAMLAGLAALVSAWAGNEALENGVQALPEQLRAAFALDWRPALPLLEPATNLFTIGRGYGLGIAQEAALKLKETCGLHAEPFSSAEVRHGPMAIVGRDFPILAFATSDAAGDDVRAVAREFAKRGARIVIAATERSPGSLPAIGAALPALQPILMIQSFYRMVNALSVRRGFDPDRPPHLNKVTRTV